MFDSKFEVYTKQLEGWGKGGGWQGFAGGLFLLGGFAVAKTWAGDRWGEWGASERDSRRLSHNPQLAGEADLPGEGRRGNLSSSGNLVFVFFLNCFWLYANENCVICLPCHSLLQSYYPHFFLITFEPMWTERGVLSSGIPVLLISLRNPLPHPFWSITGSVDLCTRVRFLLSFSFFFSPHYILRRKFMVIYNVISNIKNVAYKKRMIHDPFGMYSLWKLNN